MAYCENLLAMEFGGRQADGSTSLSSGGEPLSSHFFGQSSFATLANVSETSVVRVDPTVPLETMAPLGCGLQTGAGAVLNEIRPRAGSSFAVTGTGAVGMAAASGRMHDHHRRGPSRVPAAARAGARGEPHGPHLRSRPHRGGHVHHRRNRCRRDPRHHRHPRCADRCSAGAGDPGHAGAGGRCRRSHRGPVQIGESLVKGWTFKTVVQGSSVPQDLIPRLVELWKRVGSSSP